MEQIPNQEKPINSEELHIEKSHFFGKLFWIKPNSGEIIKARDLSLNIERKIGDEVVSNGRIFKPKGTKGIIKSFKEDTCYIGVEWEDKTVSFMKDEDLLETFNGEEKAVLIKKGIEVFDKAYQLALEKGNERLARRILGFKEEAQNKNVNLEDLLYTTKECKNFIERDGVLKG